MVVGVKVCELTDGFLWFVCGLYVGILTSPLKLHVKLAFLHLPPCVEPHLVRDQRGCGPRAQFEHGQNLNEVTATPAHVL